MKVSQPLASKFFNEKRSKKITRKKFPLLYPLLSNQQGSTIGVSIVQKEEELGSALKEAGEYDEEILVEEFMKGKEITVGILDDIPLPIIEVVPKSGFYDYHSKYTKGETQYILPARISREKYLYAQEISFKAFQTLGCSGVARVDLMTNGDENPFVIDVNTMPGMTETSLLPKAASYAGIPFEDLVERILLGASLKMESGR